MDLLGEGSMEKYRGSRFTFRWGAERVVLTGRPYRRSLRGSSPRMASDDGFGSHGHRPSHTGLEWGERVCNPLQPSGEPVL